MNEKYSNFFKSFTFKNGITLNNRVVMATNDNLVQ